MVEIGQDLNLSRKLTPAEIDEYLDILAENEKLAKAYQEKAYKTPYITPEGRTETGTTLGEMDYLQSFAKSKAHHWNKNFTRINYTPVIKDNPTLKDLLIEQKHSFKRTDRILQENYLKTIENAPEGTFDEEYLEFINSMAPDEFYFYTKMHPEIWEHFNNYSLDSTSYIGKERDMLRKD